jgi:hypothetical protein
MSKLRPIIAFVFCTVLAGSHTVAHAKDESQSDKHDMFRPIGQPLAI